MYYKIVWFNTLKIDLQNNPPKDQEIRCMKMFCKRILAVVYEGVSETWP